MPGGRMKLFFSFLASIWCCLLFSTNEEHKAEKSATFTSQKKGALHIFRSSFQNKSFITLSYTTPFASQEKELKDFWKRFLFYSLLQERLQHALSAQGIHYSYHQKGILHEPNSCTISMSCPSYQVVDAISEICRQMEKIKMSGFLEKELQSAKEKAHHGLYKLENYQTGDLARLVSNDMTSEMATLNLNSIVETSKHLIEMVSLDELTDYSLSQMIDANREIDIVVPSEESFISENDLSQILEEQKLPPEHKNSSEALLVPSGLVKLLKEDVHHTVIEEIKCNNDELQPQLEEISNDLIFKDEEPCAEETPLTSELVHDHEHYHQLPITEEEKQMIVKIILTMADNNVFKLLFEKKKLERIGKKIHHVHPIKFLGTVFSDPYLVDRMREIKDSSFKWEGFIDGLSLRMTEESSRGNLKKYLPGFCASINANLETVMSYADREDFEGLVSSLF